MAIEEKQFSELEKRFLAFKGLFGSANTLSENTLKNEQFSKGVNVFPNNIIAIDPESILSVTGTDNLSNHYSSGNNNKIKPFRIRTWVTSSESDANTSYEKIARGHFVTTLTGHTENPYVERIICPLTKVAECEGQFYALYSVESQSAELFNTYYDSSNGEFFPTELSKKQSSILKNFISPFKFGKGYKAKIYQGFADDINNPNLTIADIKEDGVGNNYEGWIFDYTEGTLFMGSGGPTRGDVDGDSTYEDYNTFGANTDDGQLPDANTTLSGYSANNLWISVYRYIGPVGFSGPNTVITASNIKVTNDLEVNNDVNINGSLAVGGLTFSNVDSFSASGNSTFGDSITDVHQFTGSVLISGTLEIDGASVGTGGGTGAPGIVTTLFPNVSSSTEYENYKKTTLFPTDANDILEYKTSFGLKISSSLGTPSYIILHGSESSKNQLTTLPDRTENTGDSTPPHYKGASSYAINYSFFDAATFNDLFRYKTINGRDYPSLNSYAPFTSSLTGYTTHSFNFTSSLIIPKIGVYYSRNLNEPNPGPSGDFTSSIAAIKFSGSVDGLTWVGLHEEFGLNLKEKLNTGGRFTTKSYKVGTDPEFDSISETNDGSQGLYNLSNNNQRLITRYTSPIFNTSTNYQYYRLHISGGTPLYQYGIDDEPTKVVQYLHHIDIYEDLYITGSNRKQININLDDDTNQTSGLTNFQHAVSNSLAAANLVIVNPIEQFLINGEAGSTLDMSNENIVNIGTASSQYITNTNTLTNTGDIISQGGLLLTSSIGSSPNPPNGSIVLDSLNPIYFTNIKQDGTSGVDTFSGRIFGHTTTDGVNDLYMDANRLYYVADNLHKFITLNSNGITHIKSSQIYLEGDVTSSNNISASGTIYASEFRLNGQLFQGGGGGAFPHSQATTEITASITGGLIISGNSLIDPPYIHLGNIEQSTPTENLPPIINSTTLYVKGDTLFFGSDAISSVSQNLDNISIVNHLTSSKSFLLTGSITASNDISASGTMSANYFVGDGSGLTGVASSGNYIETLGTASLTNITASGDISASGELFGSLPELLQNPKIVTYNTSSGRLELTDISNFTITNNQALSVSPIDVPYSSSLKQITILRDNGTQCETNPGDSEKNDCTANSSSIVDGQLFSTSLPTAINEGETFIINVSQSGEEEKDRPFQLTKQKAANIIFDFEIPVIVSKFNQTFEYELGQGFYLPRGVEVYGKNTPFNLTTNGSTDGTFLGRGAKPNNTIGDSDNWNNPIGLIGGEFALGGEYKFSNLNRVTTIPESSLTSSFRYYRLRYTGSFHGYTINQNPFSIVETKDKTESIFINEIIPVTRSFTKGTTIGFNNGVVTTNQVVTNYVDGTASYAIYAEEAGTATNGFPFNGNAVITGSLGVSGATNLNNLILDGNLNANNYSIENANNVNATSINVGNLESNNITTNTLDTNILTIGTLPTSTSEISNGINTTGPISITTIIPSNITESYTAEPEIFSVQKRYGNTNVYWDNLFGPGGKLKLFSSNFAFTSGSSSSLNDNNTNTSIIVNQNTLGTYYVPTPGEGPYPLYPLSTNDLAVEVHQTNSFFVKYKFPEPVLLEEFQISFVGEQGSLIYSEETCSLNSASFSLNADRGASHIAPWTVLSVSSSLLPEPEPSSTPSDEYLALQAQVFNVYIDNAAITPSYTVGATGANLGGLGYITFMAAVTAGHSFSEEENDVVFSEPGNVLWNSIGWPYSDPEYAILSLEDINNSDSFHDLIINYDFGEGNETIVHRYQIDALRGIGGNATYQDKMYFEASNDGTNYTLIDEVGNASILELIQNGIGLIELMPEGNGSNIWEFNPGENGLYGDSGFDWDRGVNNFTNNTAYRYYRFRFPDRPSHGHILSRTFNFFTASIEQSGTTQFNPEFISIYSNDITDISDVTDTIYAPFAFYPGTFKETQKVLANDSNITISIAQFNIDNQHPLSQYYTIEISGSHDPNNLVGISKITPVTRSFTTESITIGTIPPSPTPPTGYPVPTGPTIHWPSLPEGHPTSIDSTNAQAVYYDESSGTFYYDDSCCGDTTTTTPPVSTINTITKKGDFIFKFPNSSERLRDGVNYKSSGYIHSSSLNLNGNPDFLDSKTLRLVSMSIKGDVDGSKEKIQGLRIGGQLIATSLSAKNEDVLTTYQRVLPGPSDKTDMDVYDVDFSVTESISMVRGVVDISASFEDNVNGADHPVFLSCSFEYDIQENEFDLVKVDRLVEKTTSNGIEISSSIKLKSSTLTNNENAKRPLLVVDETTGEIFKSKNTYDGNTQTNLEGNTQIKGDLSLTGSFDAHRAIIGISGSEKRAYNEGKLSDFFTNPVLEKERYSLYVRNGATIVGGDIIPDTPLKYDLGTREFPFKDLHLKSSSIIFYSGSDETSGSIKSELGRITINESNQEIEFRSGSEFNKIRASEINLGTDSLLQSVQIGQSTQGFIAVNAEPGKYSTIFRAEHTGLSGDFRMGSITQQGSGSFAILLDGVSPGIRPDAKFAIYSNTAIPGTGTQLFTVSESFETRVYNGGLRADNYVTTTNVTASGNISASGQVYANTLQLNNLPTSPTGLPTGSVWVSGSKNDTSTNNVNCGTLMIVI